MSADYEKIRDENIARYGWDTAVLDLLGQLYSERTHFIFELIQNAEDAGATELAFELFADRLEVRHDGRPFTEADVRGVCGVGASEKSGDLTKIGQFGIGFKSVYAYTRSPRIYSAGRTRASISGSRCTSGRTPGPARRRRCAPARLTARPAPCSSSPSITRRSRPRSPLREIAAALDTIEPGTLLFLRNISRLRTGGAEVTGSVIERRTAHADGPAPSRHPVHGPWPAGRGVARLAAPARCPGSSRAARRGRLPRRHGPARPRRPARRRMRPVPAHRVLPHREGDVSRLPDPGSVPHDTGPRQRPRSTIRRTRPWCGETAALLAGVLPGTAGGRLAHGGRPGGAAARGGPFPAGLDVPPAVRLGTRDAGRRGTPAASQAATGPRPS